jgi:hypothetical protein
VFVCHTCQPVVGTLLWGSVVSDTSVVDYPDVAFLLADLSSTHRCLGIARGTAWSLVISFLSTVSCEVTGLSAKEACEDFPLSVLLDGSSWISPFSTSSYSLFVSVSSWEEIFCLGYSSARSSWGSIHCIWIALGVSPLTVERFPGIGGWWLFRFKAVGPIPHVDVNSLLVDCRRSPLFVCCGLWEGS